MPSRALRVLIIDDDEVMRRVAREALARGDWQLRVDEAATGTEGARVAAEGGHDVVLLDYQLPDVDGLQVLRRLLAASPHVPVVALTGQGSEDVAVQFIRGGAADYLAKDRLTPHRLVQTVRNVVGTRLMAGEVSRLERALLLQERSALVGAVSQTALTAFRDGMEALAEIQAALAARARPDEREAHEEAAAILSGLREVEASLSALRSLLAEPARDASTDVDAVVDEVASMYRRLARRGIRIETSAQAAVAAAAPRDAVRQILLHLLNNAMDAMTEGGAVTLSTRVEDGHLALVVEDEGPGIDPEVAPRMYDLFASGKPDHEGLGLTLVRHLALQHGGSVAHGAGAAGGARFVVRLPVARA